SNYITTQAWVSHISQANGQIIEDRNVAREVTVRLLALHVVFTMVGHPEFVWATFEHTSGPPDLTTADGRRDVAPIDPRDRNPTDAPSGPVEDPIVSPYDYALYRGGTPLSETNRMHPETELLLDEASQSFPSQQSSIVRLYPASKSNTTRPEG